MNSKLKCVDLEALLADYLDGGLGPEDTANVDLHLAECSACAELSEEASAGIGLLRDAREMEVHAPPALVRQILQSTTRQPQPGFFSKVLGLRISNIWQPRWAMSIAMAALSLVMIVHFRVAAENTAYRAWNRTWNRTIMRYENLALVDNVQDRLNDLRSQLERK